MTLKTDVKWIKSKYYYSTINKNLELIKQLKKELNKSKDL